MIVGARMKARGQMALMIGWEARNFHYVRDLKPLAEYLAAPAQKRAAKSLKVLELFQRKLAKQEAANGSG